MPSAPAKAGTRWAGLAASLKRCPDRNRVELAAQLKPRPFKAVLERVIDDALRFTIKCGKVVGRVVAPAVPGEVLWF
jgi:hypothetical protein